MLKIDECTRGEGVVLVLQGTVDMYVSPELKTRLDALTDRRTARVVLDLAGVDFIDSSGLAALVGTQRRMKKYEGRLQLAALTDRVTDVFALMQLTDLFEIHGSVQEALAP